MRSVLGELAFGEPFGSVEARKTHEWIVTVLNMVKFIAWDSAMYHVSPMLEKTLSLFIPAQVRDGAINHVLSSKANILARMREGGGGSPSFNAMDQADLVPDDCQCARMGRDPQCEEVQRPR